MLPFTKVHLTRFFLGKFFISSSKLITEEFNNISMMEKVNILNLVLRVFDGRGVLYHDDDDTVL